jgi:hypothetical protein
VTGTLLNLLGGRLIAHGDGQGGGRLAGRRRWRTLSMNRGTIDSASGAGIVDLH